MDSGFEQGNEVSIFYDPILAKLIAYGKNREEAIKRMVRALGEYHIVGVQTNIPALIWILNHNSFIDTSFDINFINKYYLPLLPDKWKAIPDKDTEVALLALSAFIKSNDVALKASENKVNLANNWESLSDG